MENLEEKPFLIEKAKSGRANCKRCKQKCENSVLRIAKLVPNFVSGSGMMKHWYHVDCLFEAFKTQKATTKRIESVDDLEGWDTLTEDERDEILEKLHSSLGITAKNISHHRPTKESDSIQDSEAVLGDDSLNNCYRKDSPDNLFRTFRDICEKISANSRYTVKSEVLQKFLIRGTNGKKFEGDIYLWIKMLLPTAVRRVYNLQSKQLVKLFSRIFNTNQDDMLTHLELGDISQTVSEYFSESAVIQPNNKSHLMLQEVDEFLEKLSSLTREDTQVQAFQNFCKKCSADDLKTIIRLIKHDLRINAGPRHVLDALAPTAYVSFQSSRNLRAVVERYAPNIAQHKISSESPTSKLSASGSSGGVQLMTPISPMLAEACKSVEKAIVKNPDGMYSEVKYDGERVQIHKKGNEFKFFSRNLKPVLDHKISRCKEFIPKAFPKGEDLILDSEIIMVNTKTGELLPFGTLGVHKREEFINSEVCLFIFDCIYYNGVDLTQEPLCKRKKVLKEIMIPIKHHVELSEYYLIKTKKELALMTAKVLRAGLEGLVLKSVNSLYKPGKRGWMKVKKDYLFEGQMADTADLVVLGGWYGTGKKGGMLSIFLMGCLDKLTNQWKTVTKVHSGLDDNQMDELQNQLKPLMRRADPDNLPTWISCKRQLVPDNLAKDPSNMPVWEITGAEFTKAEAHTANGISIRFPRITKIRNDKDPEQATSLKELESLFKKSKESVNVDLLFKDFGDIDESELELKTKFLDFIKCQDPTSHSLKDVDLKPENVRKRKMIKEEFCSVHEERKIKLESEDVKTMSDSIHDSIRRKIKKESFDVFEDIVAFILPETENHFSPLLGPFLSSGGKTTHDSRTATHVLHPQNRNTEDFFTLRKKYQPICRHLTFEWVQDSIDGGRLMPIWKYAVHL